MEATNDVDYAIEVDELLNPEAATFKNFDLEEFQTWVQGLKLKKNQWEPPEGIKFNSELTIFNFRFFFTGRLNHVAAFTNFREPGNRLLFIRELQAARKYIESIKDK